MRWGRRDADAGPAATVEGDRDGWGWWWLEVSLITLLCFLYSGGPPPEINEAHYLAKAKHYWDPAWAVGDTFLESADAHLVFYWTLGWLTRFMPLAAVAWLGRFLSWVLLAAAWRSLSRAVVNRRFYAVISAGLMIVLNHFGHMAGEWVVGGVEAKGFAYALLFWGLAALLRNQWNRVWLLFGAAAAFHVLVGGWAVLLAMAAWLFTGRPARLRAMLPGLAGGFLLSLFGLLPALALTRGTETELVREANYLYVYLRLPHHLVFHRFPHLYMARHAALIMTWLVALIALRPRASRIGSSASPSRRSPEKNETRQPPADFAAWSAMNRLHAFVAGAIGLALIGAVLDQSLLLHPRLAAPWLRYYWFRMSDAMVPAALALTAIYGIVQLQRWRPVTAARLMVAGQLALILAFGFAYLQRNSDSRPAADRFTVPTASLRPETREEQRAAYEDWVRMARWVQTETEPSTRFVTPWFQRTFKWYAGRSEVVTWKDVPQDARAILDWYDRLTTVYPPHVRRGGLAAHGAAGLHQVAVRYEADYVILDRRLSRRGVAGDYFHRVYPSQPQENPTFEVYEVRTDKKPPTSSTGSRNARPDTSAGSSLPSTSTP